MRHEGLCARCGLHPGLSCYCPGMLSHPPPFPPQVVAGTNYKLFVDAECDDPGQWKNNVSSVVIAAAGELGRCARCTRCGAASPVLLLRKASRPHW